MDSLNPFSPTSAKPHRCRKSRKHPEDLTPTWQDIDRRVSQLELAYGTIRTMAARLDLAEQGIRVLQNRVDFIDRLNI